MLEFKLEHRLLNFFLRVICRRTAEINISGQSVELWLSCGLGRCPISLPRHFIFFSGCKNTDAPADVNDDGGSCCDNLLSMATLNFGSSEIGFIDGYKVTG